MESTRLPDGKHLLSILVRADWDPEAAVWVAQSPDVPELIAESETLEQLTEIVVDMIPGLLADNNRLPSNGEVEIPVHVMAQTISKVRLAC